MKQKPKLLLDENIGLRVYHGPRRQGYQVQSILVESRGASDEEVVKIAAKHGKIIVAMDKDSGYLARAYNPPDVIILRLRDPRIPSRIKAILRALQLGEWLYGYVTIVTDTKYVDGQLHHDRVR